MFRTPVAAVAIGCATDCSIGAAASATMTRKRSNSTISALPSTMNMAERKMRKGTAARWAAALNGAVNRSTVPERSLNDVLRLAGRDLSGQNANIQLRRYMEAAR